MRFLAVIMACALLAACSGPQVSAVPPFPKAPDMLMEPPPDLVSIKSSGKVELSDILDNANTNYGQYRIISARLRAWQEWYAAQKTIFDGIK